MGIIKRSKAKINLTKLLLQRFKDKRIHPRNLILEAIPVLPICARLPLFNKGELQHDDLTNKYLDIIKVNDKIRETTNDFAREKYVDSLAFNIKILMINKEEEQLNLEIINKMILQIIIVI